MELEPDHSISEIPQARAAIPRDLLDALAGQMEVDDSGQFTQGRQALAIGRGHRMAAVLAGVVEAHRALGGEFLYPLWGGAAVLFHALDDFGEAHGVPDLKWPQLPAEAPAQGAVDRGQIVGDLRGYFCRVAKGVPKYGPAKGGAFSLRLEHSAQSLAQIIGALERVDLGKVRLLPIAVLQALEVESLNHPLAIDLGFLEEALAGLLSEKALVDHTFQLRNGGEGIELGVVRRAQLDVLRHVQENVQPHQVGGTKCRALGASQKRSGEGIHGIDVEFMIRA